MPLTILIFVAIIFVLVFVLRMARIGTLVAFLLAGVIAGPHLLNFFRLTDTWQFLGDLGILFLWFTLGLEINIRRLWDMRRTIFGFGAAQVLMVVFMLFPILFGVTNWTIMGCMMVALILAMSSTSEDLQLLTDKNQLNTNMGRQTFSILLFQDLLSIPLLAMLPIFAGKTFNFGATAIDILVMSVSLILGVIIIGRFVLNPLMKLVAKLKSKEAFLLAILLNIVIWAALMQWLGLPAGLGAFLAGMLLSETIYRYEVSAEIRPFAMLFLAFFFIYLGMGLNLKFLIKDWYIILIGLVGLVLIKFVALFIVARVRRVATKDAIRIALLLSQGGEFGLLMLETIKTSGLNILPPQHQEILIVVIILSIMLTPLLLAIFEKFKFYEKLPNSSSEYKKSAEKNPSVMICGFGRVGQIIAQMLSAEKISYVALDLDVDSVMLGRERGYNVVYGDATNSDVLVNFGLKPRKTKAVVIALDNAIRARSAILTVRRIAPKIKIFARARNLADTKVLIQNGVTMALPETIESSFFLGQGVLQSLGISDNKINKLLMDLRSDNYAAVNKNIFNK